MIFFGNKVVQARITEAANIIDKMVAGDFAHRIEPSGYTPVSPLMWALICLFYLLVKQGESKCYF